MAADLRHDQPVHHAEDRRTEGLALHFPYASYGDGLVHGEPGEGRWVEWRCQDDGKLLLHGHTHGQEQAHDRMFHVGWDAWHRFVRHEELEAWVQTFA